MSQLRQDPVPFRPEPERATLRLVKSAEVATQGRATHSPDSGLTWARAYQEKLLLSDSLIIAVATTGALFTRARINDIPTFLAGVNVIVWSAIGSIVLIWIALLGVFRTRDRRFIGAGANEYKRVITASVTTFGLVSIALVISESGFPGRGAILAMWGGLGALVLSRWLWRKWLTQQRRFGHALSRVVVVGSRADVDYVVSRIQGSLSGAYRVVGVLTDQAAKTTQVSAPRHPHEFGPEDVVTTASELGADTVIVAGDNGWGNDFIRNLAWQLEGTAAELILASRLANVAGPRIHFRPVEGLPLIHVEIPQFEGGKHIIKRAMDIVASSLALIALSPLFLVLTVLIRLDSPGSAFFSQERVGQNLKTFRMHKFRSMVPNASEKLALLADHSDGNGMLFKMKNDPRVTSVGRTLRKYSLDELPQLWNVLKGEMSLVGPRPPLPSEVLNYQGKVHRRLYIKPGLTGMWQINGRSDLSWEDSMRLDLYYVENWSLIGDFLILWRTLKVLIHPVGAY